MAAYDKKKNSTAAIAAKQNARLSGMGNAAANVLTTAVKAGPIKSAVGAARSAGGAIVNRLIDDSAAQGASLATMQNASSRNAQAKLYPEGKTVLEHRPALKPDGNIPGFGPLLSENPNSPPAPQRDGIQSKRIDPATQKSFQRAVAKTLMSAPSGQSPATPGPGQHTTSVFEQAPGNNNRTVRLPNQVNDNRQAIASIGNPELNGTMRAGVGGTMDVTFDESTPLAARKALMANPVEPKGQIIQYNNRALAEADRQTAKQALMSSPQMLTKENSTMGWKERLALNEQTLRNQGGMDQARLGSETSYGTTRMNNQNQIENTLLSGQNQLAETGLRNSGQLDNTRLQNSGNIEQIDRTATGDLQRDKAKAELDSQAEAQKRAYDLLASGVPAEPVQRLMNTQPGQTPNLNGIEVPQNTEPKVGRYRDRPIFDANGEQVGTRTLDTATGGDGPDGYEPHPQEYDSWQALIKETEKNPEARVTLLKRLRRENPELYRYMDAQEK